MSSPEQFPEWAGLPVKEVVSAGTDDGMYRLGDDVVRRPCPARLAAWQVRVRVRAG
ncbi:hypothetical protein [Streptomyces phaeochromogenes]|uniref:hypothetical protein n=1 Tax=Streptomyces phaeochromogenes TaxID=1923 RepID=UPI002DD844DA|nr:hypothetical protein [Streptomyces phaeochromogenes]WRZ36620.1 hypothetical protein OG931_34535 [Streptomyces phaeochromogenes]